MLKGKVVHIIYTFLALGLLAFSLQCTTSVKEEDNAANGHQWLNTADRVQYVGMQTCRKCHEDVYQSFSHTGMGKSFDRATKQKSAADFHLQSPIYDKYANLYYQPYWQDTALMVKEYRLEGKDTVHSRTEKIDYIIGSGHHTNSHIYNVNGYLYQAPFTWYVQEGRWDLPPGFEGGYNSRFSRSLGLECLSCHNAYPEFMEGSFNKYLSVPTGIDCERCHGPGGLHVSEKMKGHLVNIKHDTDFTIVNPAKLPYELQIDVCQRCHLQGNAVLKEGKTFFDFRPGMRLSEVMDVFMPVFEGEEDKFLMASHAERLHKSQCFLQTNKAKGTEQMTCLSCHNPHVSVKVTAKESFIAKCMNCHQSPHKNTPQVLQTKGEDCISCHMPTSSSIDIPHVTITDHYIRVVKEDKIKKEDAKRVFKTLAAINNKNPEALTRAKAFMYFYEKFDHKPMYLDSAFKILQAFTTQQKPEEYLYYYYLTADYAKIASLAKPHGPYDNALSNYQAGQAYANLNDYASSVKFLKKAVSQQPYNLDYRLKLANSYTYMQDFINAQKELDFVIEENPKLPGAWNNLGFLYLAQSDINKGQLYIRKALYLDPDYTAARINQVKVWLFENNIKQAKAELNRILKDEPGNPDAQQLLAMIEQSKN